MAGGAVAGSQGHGEDGDAGRAIGGRQVGHMKDALEGDARGRTRDGHVGWRSGEGVVEEASP